MYSVSLLPYEYRMIHTNARKKNIGLLLVTGVMCVMFFTYLILTIIEAGKEAELKGIRAETAAVDMQISRLSDLETLKKDVFSLLDTVTMAAGSNPEWESLIASIGNTVPESVNINYINLEYNGNEGVCNITGVGLSHQSVSDWMVKLQEVSGIGEIKCNISSRVTQSGNNDVNFELTIPLLAGPGYQLPVEVESHE